MNKTRRLIDLTGKKFHKLTVLSFSHFGNRRKAYWNCICECGNLTISRGDGLKSGHAKSCGCQKLESASMVSFIDLLGKQFGRLLVIEKTNKRGIGRQIYWKCKCDCGKIKVISGNNLRNGMTKSCGCLQWEAVWRGGFKRTDYPNIWGRKLRGFIRNLDNHKCQYPDCDYTDLNGKRKLNVHHIDGNKKNCQTYNLISLCTSHHKHIENKNPNKWIRYFYGITIGNQYEDSDLRPYFQ